MIPFEEFETAVMLKMLEKKNHVNEILQQQYAGSRVIGREFTGVGFFTHFKIINDSPALTELTDRNYGDIVASINGSTFDFGFVLFLDKGMISSLEGYTWSDMWPETIETYTLKHSDEIIV